MDRYDMVTPNKVHLAANGVYRTTPHTKADDLLLDTAASLLQEQAGWHIPTVQAAVLPHAKPETKPICSTGAEQYLKYVLKGHTALLLEWLVEVGIAGQRVPHAYVGRLLQIATINKGMRVYVLPVVGQRGVWLSEQVEKFGWVAKAPRMSLSKLGTCQQWREKAIISTLNRYFPPLDDHHFRRRRGHIPARLIDDLIGYTGMWSMGLQYRLMSALISQIHLNYIPNDAAFTDIAILSTYHCPPQELDEMMAQYNRCYTGYKHGELHPFRRRREYYRYFDDARWQAMMHKIKDISAQRKHMLAAINTYP
jgi:hypothetical protein